MHDEQDDQNFNEFLRKTAKDFHSGVEPPAHAIWHEIERDVETAIQKRSFGRTRESRTWIALAAGIAATLFFGIGVGRWSAATNRGSSIGSSGAATESRATGTASDQTRPTDASDVQLTRVVTQEHLAEAEVFLTLVRADMKAGRVDADRAERSRALLSRTRLLLGTQAETSPAIARLLQDLELMLAEIAALPPTGAAFDKRLLEESITDQNILPRIRASLPART